MKRKYLNSGVIWLAALPVVTAAALTTVAIFQNQESKGEEDVDTPEALVDAIDEYEEGKIDTINLTNDITLEPSQMPKEYGILVDKDLTITSANNCSLIFKNENPGDKYAAFIIDNSSTNGVINFRLDGVNVAYDNKYADYPAVINVMNGDGCHINIENSTLSSTCDCLYISPRNIKTLGININNSNLQGWTAIYNKGSNVELKAKDSVFTGQNTKTGVENDFATIIAADYPMVPRWNNCFSTNNDFTFDNCQIYAYAQSNTAVENILECRSIANNHIKFVNGCLFEAKEVGAEKKVDLFVWADNDECDITDRSIGNYKGGDKPGEIKTQKEYYAYYSEEQGKLSTISIEGKVIKDTGDKDPYRKSNIIDVGSGIPDWAYRR